MFRNPADGKTTKENGGMKKPMETLICGNKLKICLVVTGLLLGYIFISFLSPPKVLGLLIGGLLTFTVFVKPLLSIFLIVAILPFLNFLKRIDVIYLNSPLAEFNNPISLIPEILVILAFLNCLVTNRNWNTKDYNYRITIFSILIFLLCLVEIFNPGTSIMSGMMGFRYLAVFFLLVPIGINIFENRKSVLSYMKITCAVGVIVSVYSIYQAFSDFPAWDRLWFKLAIMGNNLSLLPFLAGYEFSWEEVRKFSTFNSPQAAAGFYVISIIMSLALFLNSRGVYKAGYIMAILLMAIGLFLTYTRGCWLAVVVGLVMTFSLRNVRYLRLSRRLSRGALVLVFFIISFLAVSLIRSEGGDYMLGYIPKGVQKRVVSLSDLFSDASMADRYLNWSRALELARIRPIVGFGMGTTTIASARTGRAFHVDSLYFKLLLECGLIGLILFLLLIKCVYSHASYLIKEVGTQIDPNIISALLAIVFSIAFYALVAPALEYTSVGFHFWLIIGILAKWAGLRETELLNLEYREK